MALDFVRGVVHMHSRHIIHLDLKSANLLLSRDGTAKIADVRPLSPVNLELLDAETRHWESLHALHSVSSSTSFTNLLMPVHAC